MISAANLGTELDEEIAYRIGRAYAEFLKPKKIVLGGDIRLTSEALKPLSVRASAMPVPM